MERQFQINWPALVEEAKHRRKKQKVTQAKLARYCNLSTPTIVRFEKGDTSIQVSTVLTILSVLGLLDRRELVFLDKKARIDGANDRILFFAKEDKATILFGITFEVLEDYYSGTNKDPLKVFEKNRLDIQHLAKKKYLASHKEVDGVVLITSRDFF